MAIVKWSPFRDSFRDIVSLQDEMNRLFETFAKGNDSQSLAEGTWAPSVDIYENKEIIDNIKKWDLNVFEKSSKFKIYNILEKYT